ncbi:MAG TPA: hypothetical protein VEL31_00975 [Ktedonobacteraceae bacterium]|nr:hypothetical protein [Ktedonobacteraceae bacterium]
MAISIRKDTSQYTSGSEALHASMFPQHGLLETTEQIRRFELLRLAFFVLKLRKLEQRLADGQTSIESSQEQKDEQGFRRNLLHHVIFQQVLTLIRLDARGQAMQIIEACQN